MYFLRICLSNKSEKSLISNTDFSILEIDILETSYLSFVLSI